ncbi:hypothetical protein Pla52o_27340 [Novipirellula galeiformis]|uniref:Uncharacterized protein n=1 Tax=Novipirellula galeiformis TaxID=2528004 RepID=A0A5C6CK61_9BACT|nr:DUF6655 family protein [Novipirellula galeiformis]TWU23199.1 hypothetical protein Pla52o_27340 [Novipirellula galeiformis]
MRTKHTPSLWKHTILAGLATGISVFGVGCASSKTSNTARTGTEQLLISAAIDSAFSNVQFNELAGYKVFIDEKYLDSVDKGYLVGTLRHKVFESGGHLVTAMDQADVVLEPRSGGVGTDTQESFVGIPSLGMPGLPIELPEIKFASRNTQMGTAKIGLICYDAKTGTALGSGGESTALTHNNDTYVLGIGPFRSGSVVDQRQKAVGYNGVGGSIMSTGQVAKSAPVRIIDRNEAGAPFTPAAQIADTPTPTDYFNR